MDDLKKNYSYIKQLNLLKFNENSKNEKHQDFIWDSLKHTRMVQDEVNSFELKLIDNMRQINRWKHFKIKEIINWNNINYTRVEG